MSEADPIRYDHPANQKILQYIQKGNKFYPDAPVSLPRSEVDWDRLHTHPDLIGYFWRFTEKNWALHSHPILVHPVSGIIYGYAGGTGTIALRLPAKEREIAYGIEGYGKRLDDLDASALGDDWAFIEPFSKDNPAFFEAAYQYAGL